MRISDWSSDVCSSDLRVARRAFIELALPRLLIGDVLKDFDQTENLATFAAHGVECAFGDEVAAVGPAPTMFAAAMPVRARKIERLLRRAAARIAVGEQLRIRPSDHFALAPAGQTARATIPAGDAAVAVDQANAERADRLYQVSVALRVAPQPRDRKSTRLNSSH